MIRLENLGWDQKTVGDIDHKLMTPPFLRLAEYKEGQNGDTVALFDFRIEQPNEGSLSPIMLHSIEHILLEGFRYYLPDNLINVAPMGCQTGMYIVLINFMDASDLKNVVKKILIRALTLKEVPYSNEQQCGQAVFHSIEKAQLIINKVLSNIHIWDKIIK